MNLKKLMEDTWNYSGISDPLRVATWKETQRRQTVKHPEENYMYGVKIEKTETVSILNRNPIRGRMLNFKRSRKK
jgi:hypothetical protein